jgi:hypothetical protein
MERRIITRYKKQNADNFCKIFKNLEILNRKKEIDFEI